MAELDGKVALVRSAGMGIGVLTARALVAEIDAAAGNDTVATIAAATDVRSLAGPRAFFVTGDVVRVDGGLAIKGD